MRFLIFGFQQNSFSNTEWCPCVEKRKKFDWKKNVKNLNFWKNNFFSNFYWVVPQKKEGPSFSFIFSEKFYGFGPHNMFKIFFRKSFYFLSFFHFFAFLVIFWKKQQKMDSFLAKFTVQIQKKKIIKKCSFFVHKLF